MDLHLLTTIFKYGLYGQENDLQLLTVDLNLRHHMKMFFLSIPSSNPSTHPIIGDHHPVVSVEIGIKITVFIIDIGSIMPSQSAPFTFTPNW